MKKCSACQETKLLSEFGRKSDGRIQGRCVPCLAKYFREYAASHRQSVRKAKAKWEKANSKRISHRKVERYNADPEYRRKVLARGVVYTAVKKGLLTRLPCQKCGSSKSHGHHHDYSRPLEVEWLCLKCHLAEHGVAV